MDCRVKPGNDGESECVHLNQTDSRNQSGCRTELKHKGAKRHKDHKGIHISVVFVDLCV